MTSLHEIMSMKRPGLASTIPAVVNTCIRGADMADVTCSECPKPVYARGWCRNHYLMWYRRGTVERERMATPSDALAVRTATQPNGCIWFMGSVTRDGYGSLASGGVVKLAHRVAYEIARGPIPVGMTLDHLCHTNDPSCRAGTRCLHRRCVNPAHLEPVTPVENSHRGRAGGARQKDRVVADAVR